MGLARARTPWLEAGRLGARSALATLAGELRGAEPGSVELGARADNPPNSLVRFRASGGSVSFYEDRGRLWREDRRGRQLLLKDVSAAYFLPVRGDPWGLELELQVWTSLGDELALATAVERLRLRTPLNEARERP